MNETEHLQIENTMITNKRSRLRSIFHAPWPLNEPDRLRRTSVDVDRFICTKQKARLFDCILIEPSCNRKRFETRQEGGRARSRYRFSGPFPVFNGGRSRKGETGKHSAPVLVVDSSPGTAGNSVEHEEPLIDCLLTFYAAWIRTRVYTTIFYLVYFLFLFFFSSFIFSLYPSSFLSYEELKRIKRINDRRRDWSGTRRRR